MSSLVICTTLCHYKGADQATPTDGGSFCVSFRGSLFMSPVDSSGVVLRLCLLFLVCAARCAGRTMGCVTIQFWVCLVAALFLKRSVNE